jgi:Holliday junction resolvasome RuvABC endonuclease subunit
MNKTNPNHFRILSIAPSTRGISFAVLEGRDTLVNWGVKAVQGKGNKNAKSLAKAEELIARYQPDVLVVEDALAKRSLRYPRIRKLVPQIVRLSAKHKVKIKLFSREQVMQAFIPNGQGSKHALAEIIAGHFPEQLGSKLPPKRKAWTSEHYQTGIFEAMSMVLLFRRKHIN